MSQPNNPPRSLSRRRLLQGMAALSLTAACASLFPAQMAAAQQSEKSGFSVVSAFLVSRATSPILSQRYYAALNRHYPDFPARLAALAAYLDGQKFAHVDDFLQAVNEDDPLRHTATLIVGAWYTGVVGEGADIELIAYADAMMYLPTKGILIVPSYGIGPDSWGNQPVERLTEQGREA